MYQLRLVPLNLLMQIYKKKEIIRSGPILGKSGIPSVGNAPADNLKYIV